MVTFPCALVVSALCISAAVVHAASPFGPPPPPTCTLPVTPAIMAPRLWMTGSRVVLENTHFRAELTTSPGIALTSFVNKALGNSSLLSEAGPVFAVLVEGAAEGWEYSDAFVVTNRGRESAGLGRRLQMEFVSTQLHLSGQFSIYLSAASEMLWRLELRNDGAAARRLCVAFPLLPAVRLSDDPSQDY